MNQQSYYLKINQTLYEDIHSSLSVLILSVVLYACNNAHFLKEENYRNQVTEDFEQKKQALPHGDLFTVFSNPDLSVYEQEALMFLYAYMPIGM